MGIYVGALSRVSAVNVWAQSTISVQYVDNAANLGVLMPPKISAFEELNSKRVESDGPCPCNLAVVGESPGRKEVELGRGWVGPAGKVLWGGRNLIPTVLGRERETVYCSNVSKTSLPDREWEKLSLAQQAAYYTEIRSELLKVKPLVVLAMGRRACTALIPGFYSITREHGKPKWGYDEQYIVMPCWHPAAGLRGNTRVFHDLILDFSEVPDLLVNSLPKPLKTGEPLPWKTTDECLDFWPNNVSFLKLTKKRKAKCQLCGKKTDVGQYEGDGLKWILCRSHAIISEDWAKANEPVMVEEATLERARTERSKMERAANRFESKVRKKWAERDRRPLEKV